MKYVYILGATGSIGAQTIEVVKENTHSLKVMGLSLGYRNQDEHAKIIRTLAPEIVCLRESNKVLEKEFKGIKFVYGKKGLIELVKYPKDGIVVNGISGSAGLEPTVEAIKAKKDIALANKETLVMAGDIINELIKTYQVKLIPVDSEHNAIYSALVGKDIADVKSITLTASGGSFRDLNRKELLNVNVEQALKHPNWKMGPKITIDSATLVNKGLEVIEAHHLFGLNYDQIKTVIHKESIVHGFVTFNDESVKAVMASPNMKMPIQYALTYPKHLKTNINPLNLEQLKLSFEPVDYKRYPLLKLAYEVGMKGGLYPVIYNGANEAAVKLFLNKEISFLDIENIIIKEVETFNKNIEDPNLEQIIKTNDWIIGKVLKTYGHNN